MQGFSWFCFCFKGFSTLATSIRENRFQAGKAKQCQNLNFLTEDKEVFD